MEISEILFNLQVLYQRCILANDYEMARKLHYEIIPTVRNMKYEKMSKIKRKELQKMLKDLQNELRANEG